MFRFLSTLVILIAKDETRLICCSPVGPLGNFGLLKEVNKAFFLSFARGLVFKISLLLIN